MSCRLKKKFARQNAKANLVASGAINQYNEILDQQKLISEMGRYRRHGQKEYGFTANFILYEDVNQSNKVIFNEAAFRAVDVLRGTNKDSFLDAQTLSYLQEARTETHEVFDADFHDFFSDMNAFNDNTGASKGITELVTLKKGLLARAHKRLAAIGPQLRANKDNEVVYTQLTELKKQLKEYIEGSPTKGIRGLENEIADLEKIDTRSPELIAPYIEKELDRLGSMVTSSDPNLNREAAKVLDFIISMGNFSKDAIHPLYHTDEMYDKDGLIFTSAMTQPFRDWAARATKLQEVLTAKGVEIVTDTFNANPHIQAMYNREFSYDEIVSKLDGLKDATLVDSMVMDISAGIFSHNGLMPQVIRNMVDIQFEKEEAWAKALQNKIDELAPAVQKELRKLGFGLDKFGLKGISYDLFTQKFENGSNQSTGNIVDKYSNAWFEDRGAMQDKFNQSFRDAMSELDDATRAIKFAAAYAERNKWMRANTKFINPAMIGSIVSNPAYAELASHFTYSAAEIAAHEQELKDLMGDKHYEVVIGAQEERLKQFITQRKIALQGELTREGKTSYADLSPAGKTTVDFWVAEHSPFAAIDYLNSTASTNRHSNFEFSTYIPLRENSDGQPTNYYDSNYEVIEANPVLKEFYDAIYDATSTMRDKLPYDIQRQLLNTSIPNIKKSVVELILDKNMTANQAISEVFRRMLDYIKDLLSINKQDQFVQGNSIEDNKINDVFMQQNAGKINKLFTIKKGTFIADFNREAKIAVAEINKIRAASGLRPITAESVMLGNMSKYKSIKSANITEDMALIISSYLGQKFTKQQLIDRYGETIPVGKIVYRNAQHEVAQEKSFDLPKVIKLYTHLTAQYVARQEVLPVIELMKEHYQSIKTQITQNTDDPIYNKDSRRPVLKGTRTKAIAQFDDWFERVVLGNYGLKKHYGVGEKKLYSTEEQKYLAQINKAIDAGAPESLAAELEAMRNRMGSNVAASAVVDSLMKAIRFKGLGFNFSSSITNFIEGQTANAIGAAQGEDFTEEQLRELSPTEMMVNDVIKHTSPGSVSKKVAKAYYLTAQTDILQDNTNDLQKASSSSSMTKLKFLNPFYLSKKPEHYNQIPLMVATLKGEPIVGINGEESNVWDALVASYNDNTKQWTTSLKSEFATEENKKNWEDFNGMNYFAWKTKISNIIKNTHGNLGATAGMMAKSHHIGQMAMMYKSWLPSELRKRFGIEQVDVSSRRKFKGRYRSFTPISGSLVGLAAGAIFLSPVGGVLIGATVGFGMSKYFGGVTTGLTAMQELAMILKLQTRKLIGMPVNLLGSLVGKNAIIKTNLPDAMYAEMQNTKDPSAFTPQDFANYRGNMQELAMMLTWFGMLMLSKAMFWDDDDETDSLTRITHNLLANRFFQLASSTTQYLNPYALMQDMSLTWAPFRLVDDVIVLGQAAQKAVNGHDRITSGVNRGKSRLVNEFGNATVPGLFSSYAGFGKQMEREFKPQAWNAWFYGEEKDAQLEIKQKKVRYENDLSDEDLTKEQLEERVKERYPRRRKGQSWVDKLEEIEAAEAELEEE